MVVIIKKAELMDMIKESHESTNGVLVIVAKDTMITPSRFQSLCTTFAFLFSFFNFILFN